MKILVTGGCGFIGSNFIHYWLKNYPENEIINLDKLTYAGNLDNLKDIEGLSNYKFVKGDIGDFDLVDNLMKEVEKIVHFAAESHVDNSILGPDVFVETNVVGTHVLLKAALKNKIKHFHHISTDEVFGSLPLESGEKFNENTLYEPSSPYSASKAGSDHLVRAYYKTYGLPITITNCANNYGPYQHWEKFLPKAITNLLSGKKVPVYGDGLNVRDWLYVDDHCRAIDLVLQKGKIGETYCVGGMTEDASNLEIVRKILKILDKSEEMIEFVKDRPGHDRKYAIDWNKAKRELGYEPMFGLDEYLEKTVKWYQENKWWWKRVVE
jgi:dTDP-glucose 4,6-dehydratase